MTLRAPAPPAADPLPDASVLAAALSTGLLARLVDTSVTPAEHARALALDERATALVLSALVALGWAVDAEGRVGASAALREMVARPLGRMRLDLWAHVETFLRTGEPLVRVDGPVGMRGALYRDVVAGLGERWRGPAELLAASLTGRLPPDAHILDVGAGSGAWSLAVASRLPGAQVTALDLPDVLERFEAAAETAGLRGRCHRLAGSWFEVALPERAFDLVVLANVLHLENAAGAAALVHAAGRAVRADGRVVIVDAVVVDDAPAAQRAHLALYALNLGMRTRGGALHGRAALEGWLRDAGLSSVTAVHLGETTALVGAAP